MKIAHTIVAGSTTFHVEAKPGAEPAEILLAIAMDSLEKVLPRCTFTRVYSDVKVGEAAIVYSTRARFVLPPDAATLPAFIEATAATILLLEP